MKSQEISSVSPLNRALKLNEQLEGMREKNVNLYDQNQELNAKNKDLGREREGLVQLVTDLNKELNDLNSTSMATEKRLYGELRNMQASWDSLYEEHRAAEERRERDSQAKNTERNGEEFMTEEEKINQQANFLNSAVKKQSAPSDMVSPMEQKMHELEDENKKLKSKVVQFQTKYREEKYKNENVIKEDDTTSITDSDSACSVERSPAPGVNLLASFSKRNMGRRPSLLTSSRGPKFSQSTKNLWGRIATSSRNIKQQTEVEFSTINLAFSREE